MTCLEPLTPDEFTVWYRHIGRLRLFWAKPLVELFPLYRIAEGCVLKARWASERPKIEEAYIAILKKIRKLDFLLSLRGLKILITPETMEDNLYQQKASLYLYATSRPCATGIHLEKVPEGYPEPTPDHVVVASSQSELRYLFYLNRWSFNIDYLWVASGEYIDKVVENAVCEARRLGGRYITIVAGGGHLDSVDLSKHKPDFYYNIYKLSF